MVSRSRGGVSSYHPGRNSAFVGYKVTVHVAGDKAGGGRLPHDNVNDILAVEVARLAQEGLGALVVVRRVVNELGRIATVGLAGDVVADGPAGEGPGAFLDVVFAVVELAVHAHAHGEELQQFTAIVFVNVVLVAEAVVQEVDHGRVLGNLNHSSRKLPMPFARSISSSAWEVT